MGWVKLSSFSKKKHRRAEIMFAGCLRVSLSLHPPLPRLVKCSMSSVIVPDTKRTQRVRLLLLVLLGSWARARKKRCVAAKSDLRDLRRSCPCESGKMRHKDVQAQVGSQLQRALRHDTLPCSY